MGSLIGIDTHKDSLTCCAVDELGRELESVHAVNDGRGFRKVERFASRFRASRVGIECSGSYGLALAQHLMAAGFDVREVPGQLVKRDRRAESRGKSDALDALLIARVVARGDNLPPPPFEGLAHDLKALVDHRETLLNEATRHRNRAHAILTQIRPGYSRVVAALTSTAQLQAARELILDDSTILAEVLRDALVRVEELDASAKALEKQIDALVKVSGTTLTQIVGIAAITAGRIIGELRDVGRLSGQAAFGVMTGTAPVPASSGKTERWRLNRGGNRQLNRAMHTIALTQSSHDARARVYLQGKRAAGKTERGHEMSEKTPRSSRLSPPHRGQDDGSLDIEAHERLHQGIDYVTPAERHDGRHVAVIEARRRGMQEAKQRRRMEAYGGVRETR